MAKTILVVEDRPNWRTAFCGYLRDKGYVVIEANCGIEFKKKAEIADAIVLDITMPMVPFGSEVKTAGLDVLLDLQNANPDHEAIQNPIIRSMWDRDFFGPKYEQINVKFENWLSRETPIAELIGLIKNVLK